MASLKIDVYEVGTSNFLGYREIPYPIYESGEQIISNHEEINEKVREVSESRKKDVYFKTTIIN